MQKMILTGFFLINSLAFAKTIATQPILLAQNSSIAITQPEVMKKPEEKRFSLDLSLSNSQNTFESSQYEKTNTYALEIAPAYKISEQMNLSALTYVIHDPKDQENPMILKSTALAWTLLKKQLSQTVTFTPSILGVLPTNSLQVRDEKYRGGLGIKGSFTFKGLASSKLDITAATSLRKSFHEYDISASGDPLIEYSMPQEIRLDYKLSSTFSTSLLSRYIFAKTYGGVDRQKFLADLSLTYQMNPMFSFNTGVSNEADAFKADGVGSNIRLFGAETTEVYFGVGISI